MTKKLFAIVLAAILAITMFTFPTFAAGETGTALTWNPDSKSITAIWQSLGADIVRYDLTLYRDGDFVKSAYVTDMNKLSYVFPSITAGGNYEVLVEGKTKNSSTAQAAATITLDKCSVPVTSSSGSGAKKLTVTSENSILKAEWTAQTGATKYKVDYSYKTADGKTRTNTDTDITGTSYTFSGLTYSSLLSVKVTAGTSNGYDSSAFASWSNSGTSSGSGSGSSSSTNNLTVNGNVSAEISNGFVVGTINDNNYGIYRVGVMTSGSSDMPYSYLDGKTFSIPIYGYNAVYIVVQGGVNYNSSAWSTVAEIVYNNGSSFNPNGSGNVTLTQGYDGYPVLTWYPVSNATKYIIHYQGNNISTGSQEVSAYTTSWPVPFVGYTNTYNLAVVAVMSNGYQQTLGIVNVNNGIINNNFNYGQQSGNGVVTQGYNCTVTSYQNYAYIQWNSTGSSQYTILVYRNNDSTGSQLNVYNQTSAQIQISNAYDYNISVYDTYNSYSPIAYATVKAQSGSLNNITGVTKTTIKNLKVTPLNSYSTAISWDKVDGTQYYVALYGLLNGGATEEVPVYRGDTSVTIPFGSNTPYQITVYAVNASGSRTRVGYVYNVPGTTPDGNASIGKDYPSEFTAKSSDKKISLSWKAAENASSYTIYYKRASSSSWNKIDQKITKTAVKISGLTNGIDYNFKVIPNKGSESGIVTIAPSASSSRTVTAKDPSSSSSNDGDINLDDEELTVTSVSSTTKGKIKVTWSNVGAPSYKIYVAEGTSNSYKPCGTYTGTSATISTFGSGSSATSFKSGKTYKVRIVRTDYSGSIKDALKACPYKSVTVK